MPDSTTEIRLRHAALAREYPLADWKRDDLMTRAAESALEHVLWRSTTARKRSDQQNCKWKQCGKPTRERIAEKERIDA